MRYSIVMILITAIIMMIVGACAPVGGLGDPYLPQSYQQDESAMWKEALQKRQAQRQQLAQKVSQLNKSKRVTVKAGRNSELIKSAVEKALLQAGHEVREEKASVHIHIVNVNTSRGNRLEEIRWYQNFYRNYYGRNCPYNRYDDRGGRGGDPRHEVHWTSVELVIKKTCPNGRVYSVGNGRGSSITQMEDRLEFPQPNYSWESSEEESLFSAAHEAAQKAILDF